ncbi:hypothetical protein P4233_08720 [Pseudomonas aeruginosa]|nr:hypothetical protein [Pseudomonas aeruginosa]
MKSAWLDNQGRTLSSAGTLAVTSQGALNNQGGRLASDAGLQLEQRQPRQQPGRCDQVARGRRFVPATRTAAGKPVSAAMRDSPWSPLG